MSEAVVFKGVEFSFPEALALKDLNFSLNLGEYIGIIGPNGSGKSTLLKLMMGMITPQKGKVSLFGKAPEEASSQIGYVPQKQKVDPLFPLSVLDLVLTGTLSNKNWFGFYRKQDREKAFEVLELLGLKDKTYAPFSTLSGGQAQRALIARALASDPKILLLDEPTANVDQEAQLQILSLLKQLQKDRLIVMVTHHLEVAVREMETILCMQDGGLSILKPEDVCRHFSIGLYHDPSDFKEKG